MKPVRKRRLIFVLSVVVGVSIASGLLMYALKRNINLYFTPSQALQYHMPDGKVFRMGGMVEKGTFKRVPNSLSVSFKVTDFKRDMLVKYTGILPTLFREGQGIVVQGKLNQKGIFMADQVLAKHDAKYMPPGIKNTVAPT